MAERGTQTRQAGQRRTGRTSRQAARRTTAERPGPGRTARQRAGKRAQAGRSATTRKAATRRTTATRKSASRRTAAMEFPVPLVKGRRIRVPVPRMSLPRMPQMPRLRQPKLPRLSDMPTPPMRLPRLPQPSGDHRVGQMLWYGGLATVTVLGIVEWPVAAVVAAGSYLLDRRLKAVQESATPTGRSQATARRAAAGRGRQRPTASRRVTTRR